MKEYLLTRIPRKVNKMKNNKIAREDNNALEKGEDKWGHMEEKEKTTFYSFSLLIFYLLKCYDLGKGSSKLWPRPR